MAAPAPLRRRWSLALAGMALLARVVHEYTPELPAAARPVAGGATGGAAGTASRGVAASAHRGESEAAFLAPFSAEPAASGRRAALQTAARLLALLPSAGLGLAEAAHAEPGDPLPPPVLKDVARAAPKIQEGADWLFFELRPALQKEDLGGVRQCLGSALKGAHVSPIEQDMLFPMEQLLSVNLYSEEDGWLSSVRQIKASMDEIQDYVTAGEWKSALASWETARQSANKVMVDINNRGDQAYFVPLGDDYEDKRFPVYLKKKKADIAERNNKGTLALR